MKTLIPLISCYQIDVFFVYEKGEINVYIHIYIYMNLKNLQPN